MLKKIICLFFHKKNISRRRYYDQYNAQYWHDCVCEKCGRHFIKYGKEIDSTK